MSYIIHFIDTSGNTGEIIPDLGFYYTDNLNEINDSKLSFSGSGNLKRSLIGLGSQVKIYRNEILEFHGLVDDLENYDGGAMSVHASGFEVWLAKENGDYSSSPWKATASATIFNSLIGESSYLSAGTIETGTTLDFRVDYSSSIFNAIKSLLTNTGQDYGIDYASLEIDVWDHKGSLTSVETLNNGIQIGDVQITKSYPIGNDVRVYGKGDGNSQIKSELTSGQDATSKATYGTIRKIILDSTVQSVSEANSLADLEVARLKDPRKIYSFDVFDSNKIWESGDVITLNALGQDVSDEEVRIVQLKRGMKGETEFLEVEVTNKEYSEKTKTRDELLAKLEKNYRDSLTYMQGTSNILVFSGAINCKSTAPLNLTFNIPEEFIIDEAGNLRVQSFTLDYDVDEFRTSVGTATESSVAPDVLNSSGNTEPGVSGDSGSDAPNVSGVSGTYSEMDLIDSDINLNVACPVDSWTQVAEVTDIGADGVDVDLLLKISLNEDGGGPEDFFVRASIDSVVVFNQKVFDLDSDETVYFNVLVPEGADASTDDVEVEIYPTTGAINLGCNLHVYSMAHNHDDGSYAAANHSHDDGSYAAANHDHSDGSYNAASHNHSVSVGDDADDSGSINATEVNIYLDFWNGSAWVNKHSILNTGKTLDTDVDISNSETYPDAGGFWRVRIYTDSSSPDLVQAIVKCKHQLDT